MSETWLWMTAAELGRGIGDGAIDARELTEVYLAAIDSHPEAPGIYARITPERARAEAAAAAGRAEAGVRRGPLDGVPVSWKDLFDTAGVVTEAGSGLLRGRVPESDARVLAAATRAGLVCLGKTHMTELAFSGLGVNPVTATPPNINDPELVPGGSSSGAAASVAFGLAAAGIGSDTGGSVRVPSAWNDLVGLKTTHGLLSLEGVVPLCPRFDTVGPLCRSVEDAALLLAAMAGTPAIDLAGASLEGGRLAILDTSAIGPTRSGPQTAFEAAIGRIAAAGARIEPLAFAGLAPMFALAPCLFAAEAYGVWSEAIEAEPEAMFAPIRERFRAGKGFSAPEYVAGWRRLEAIRAGWAEAAAGFDAVLLPTVANLAPNAERCLADPAHFAEENLLALRNTRVGNMLGLCALTLPSGTPGCGVMAMGAPGEEARLLRLGAAMERALA
ncbi:amidase [Amaricoccus sp.]|uniref:amidase n=1 Tax=Amaricoccus sp. TaxID=1872485 RepID=UPI00260938CD|nr:amidase [Amaricoccus sp.]HRO12055.1 amidase [Amaricoccus sp.]